MDYLDDTFFLLSYNLEKIADIPAPQRITEYGFQEDVIFDFQLEDTFVANGTVYSKAHNTLYRLNTNTYEWEDMGEYSLWIRNGTFCGRYILGGDGIYDCVTEEQVFEYGELYPPYSPPYDIFGNLSYFGGDKYLGYNRNNGEYRWVNLTDRSMSDPLPFPDLSWTEYVTYVTILNDTYCAYQDDYGWFLWNYTDGTKETIMLFDK